jgi:PAS domain S-box-containing protein
MNPAILSAPVARRFGMAVLCTLVAVAVRALLTPVLEHRFPFATLFFAVLVAAWYGGYGPALLSVLLGACLSVLFFFKSPEGSLLGGPDDQVGMVLFLMVGGGIAILGGLMRDAQIRAQSAAAEAMRQREFQRITLHSIGDAVIVTDELGYITALNPVACKLSGWRVDHAISKPLSQVFVIRNEATGEPVVSPVDSALQTGTVVGVANHTVLIAADGRVRSIDHSAAPIRDERGKIRGVIVVFRDVTERRRAQAILDENNERRAAIVESALDCIITMDHEGRIVEFNPAAQRTFGYTAEQALGSQVGDLIVPPHLRDQHYRGLAHYLATGEGPVLNQRIEIEAMRADDSLILVELAIARIGHSQTPIFTAYVREITRSKMVERRRNARLTISQTLARTTTVGDAAKAVLEVICKSLDWEIGALWIVDREQQVLCCVDVWHEQPVKLAEFERFTRSLTFKADVGLPGRVWRSQAPAWISDVTVDPNFPRAAVASHAGLRGAFGCPLISEGNVVGVIEFFSSRLREPDEDLLEMMSSVGSQIGQVIDRRRAEEALHDAEQRTASVVDHVVDGIVTIDERGTIHSINPAVQKLFGYGPEELVGQNVKLIMPEPYRSEHDGYIADYLQTGVAKVIGIGREVQGLRKDGTTFPLDLAISEFRYDNQRYFTGIVRDISERKKAEEALRFLVDATVTLSSLTDETSTLQKMARVAVPFLADWCVVYLVRENRTIDRVAAAHVLPSKVQYLDELQQRWPPALDTSATAQVMRSGRPELFPVVTEDTLKALAQDDSHLEVLRRLTPKSYMFVPLNVRGNVIGAIGLIISESDRRYDEADLSLAQELAGRAAVAIENARLYFELREADRHKDEFLAMLAHELRNPLAPIRNAIELLNAGVDTETADWAKTLMQRQVQHMVRLVDDLLDVSRVMQGKIQLKKEIIDLRSAVDHALEEVRPAIDAQEQEFSVSLPPNPVWVQADPVRLSQVVSNLLNNASKYTDRRGRVGLEVGVKQGQVIITVRDSGIGIEPHMLNRVFAPFTQVANSLDRSRGGLGIGLALVRSLVEMHGGTVTAHSGGLGRGSEFVVRLPVETRKQERDASSGKPAAIVAKRVLVVDDNQGAAQSMGLLLGKLWGHEVQLAYDGIDALDRIREWRPDVVLLDIGLPGMNGYEVARRARSIPGGDAILLVALTGYGQAEDRRKSLESGFDDHLVKPAPISALQEIFNHRKVAPR